MKTAPRLTWLQLLAIVALFGALAFLLFGLLAFDAHGEGVKAQPPLDVRLYELLDGVNVAPPPADRPETSEELHERLHEIAEDAADAAHGDPANALLLLGVAEEESHFAKDIDEGPCREGACDHGRAHCSMQIWSRTEEEGARLFADRRYCFARGLALLQSSEHACASYSQENRLAQYAGGNCDSIAGQEGSHRLVEYVGAWQGRWWALLAKENAAR